MSCNKKKILNVIFIVFIIAEINRYSELKQITMTLISQLVINEYVMLFCSNKTLLLFNEKKFRHDNVENKTKLSKHLKKF